MKCGIVIAHARTARVGLPLTLVHALDSLPVAAGTAIVEISWFRQPTNEVPIRMSHSLCASHLFMRIVGAINSVGGHCPNCGLERRRFLAPIFGIPTHSCCTIVIVYQVIFFCIALQGPPCVSLARDVLECWGLNVSQMVTSRSPFGFLFIMRLLRRTGLCASDSCFRAHFTCCAGARESS